MSSRTVASWAKASAWPLTERWSALPGPDRSTRPNNKLRWLRTRSSTASLRGPRSEAREYPVGSGGGPLGEGADQVDVGEACRAKQLDRLVLGILPRGGRAAVVLGSHHLAVPQDLVAILAVLEFGSSRSSRTCWTTRSGTARAAKSASN